jgi:predicted DNA-binding antitoxin AbrB/MazE fold protein
MTITIDATYEDGVLKPTEALPLAEHARVRLTAEEPIQTNEGVTADERGAEPTLLDKLLAIANSIPDEIVNTWPTDGASQHDHYIYGTPKRTDLRDNPKE